MDSGEVTVQPGQSLFDYAEQIGVVVPTSCRKQGKCRECLVEIVAGEEYLSEPTPEEGHLQGAFRLACRCRIVAETGVVRCHTLRRAAMRIVERGVGLPTRAQRRLDPAVTRAGDRVLLDNEDIANSRGPLHGLAVDLGTTTIVLRLVDLESGELIASSSFENPQRFGGSDVVARIDYDSSHKGRLLQRTLLGYLGHAIDAFPVDPQTIYEIMVAGNSTMRDLFFGLDVTSLGQKPFYSITQQRMIRGEQDSTSVSTTARKLRLPIHPRARVCSLPLVASHVGADAAACLLAIDMPREERLIALMDIGTNTELIIGNARTSLAASCPGGPAFEGGAVSCGMPGLDGAIEKIRLDTDGSVRTQVIGDAAPVGICGSGLIELLSELLRTGRINARGRFTNGARCFAIDPKMEIDLNERDISELAQAKAANAAGLHIVLKQFGASPDDIEVFYLAGGFGRHLDIKAAAQIGLIPGLDPAKVVQIGNAAIEGATIALLSVQRRQELGSFVRDITHVELQNDPAFLDYFTDGCLFGPQEHYFGADQS
ncbi:MAG: DUF4445 domain-containing protein [Hyphomicrobiales bacterium]|nr:DUF4445 domain-containing protein [Hyphomicrobiales bacterium]